uniref:Uncharacterized protein n=1 Tax=Glossina brevipalpis TaxID=37001 RepID=A0A1A9WLX7_9MUSC
MTERRTMVDGWKDRETDIFMNCTMNELTEERKDREAEIFIYYTINEVTQTDGRMEIFLLVHFVLVIVRYRITKIKFCTQMNIEVEDKCWILNAFGNTNQKHDTFMYCYTPLLTHKINYRKQTPLENELHSKLKVIKIYVNFNY